MPRYLGGIETQLVALAKGLAREDCDVSLITYDHGQPDGERFEGVTAYNSHPPDLGVPVVRSFHPRSTRLWKAMRRANADVYLQMGAGIETGQVAFGCRLLANVRRKFVFCMASDANFGRHLKAGIEGRLYRYGLRRADHIVAQTVHQKEGLRQATGLTSEVIPMAAAPPFTPGPSLMTTTSGRVLWVGRITPEKRLDWLLDAARASPGLTFDVVGTPNKASDYASNTLNEAASLPNVRVHGRASMDELGALYRNCAVVCCTSTMEGFPTTFLEAWSCGIPVVTTFDPDGVVARYGLGQVASDRESLIAHLTGIMGNPARYAALSESARRYYLQHHTLETVCRRFRRMFQRTVGQN